MMDLLRSNTARSDYATQLLFISPARTMLSFLMLNGSNDLNVLLGYHSNVRIDLFVVKCVAHLPVPIIQGCMSKISRNISQKGKDRKAIGKISLRL